MDKDDNAKLLRFLDRMRVMALESRMRRRLDRCCHGGVVSYRLPLWYRLDCANRPRA